jgi:hypothetical protein
MDIPRAFAIRTCVSFRAFRGWRKLISSAINSLVRASIILERAGLSFSIISFTFAAEAEPEPNDRNQIMDSKFKIQEILNSAFWIPNTDQQNLSKQIFPRREEADR